MSRFGNSNIVEIDQEIENCTPRTTKRTHISIWNQFSAFYEEKGYVLNETTSVENLANILKDYAFNMKKVDGTDYKEGVIKTMWNITAKQLQQLYFDNYNIVFDPFKDVMFRQARNARDTKRKLLQKDPTKKKQSSKAFTPTEYQSIIQLFDEDTAAGLQKKFYQIAAVELAWRGGEAVNCLVDYFQTELDNKGIATGKEFKSIQ